jgi:small-conductance mechanosensitive channel
MGDKLKNAEQIFFDLDKIPFLSIVLVLASAFLLTYILKKYLPSLAEKLPPKFRYYILPLGPILRVLIIIGAIFVVIPMFIRPSLQNFVAIFGSVGLALGFAFKDFASSLIAGIIALYEQPYRVGDRVTIDGIYGEVVAINLRSLKILTYEDTAVTIPHSRIWNDSIQNANDGSREQMCVADFYLKPDHDPGKIKAILRDVAVSSPFTLLKRPIAVVVKEQPWATHYKIKAYPVDGRDEFLYISDLTLKGRQALSEIGAEFAQAVYTPQK